MRLQGIHWKETYGSLWLKVEGEKKDFHTSGCVSNAAVLELSSGTEPHTQRRVVVLVFNRPWGERNPPKKNNRVNSQLGWQIKADYLSGNLVEYYYWITLGNKYVQHGLGTSKTWIHLISWIVLLSTFRQLVFHQPLHLFPPQSWRAAWEVCRCQYFSLSLAQPGTRSSQIALLLKNIVSFYFLCRSYQPGCSISTHSPHSCKHITALGVSGSGQNPHVKLGVVRQNSMTGWDGMGGVERVINVIVMGIKVGICECGNWWREQISSPDNQRALTQ